MMKGKWQNGIYTLLENIVMGTMVVSFASKQDNDCIELWYCRLGHMSEQGLTMLSKRGLLKGAETGKLKFCESCVMGKQRRVKFSSDKHTFMSILEDIHSDLWGLVFAAILLHSLMITL